ARLDLRCGGDNAPVELEEVKGSQDPAGVSDDVRMTDEARRAHGLDSRNGARRTNRPRREELFEGRRLGLDEHELDDRGGVQVNGGGHNRRSARSRCSARLARRETGIGGLWRSSKSPFAGITRPSAISRSSSDV